MAATGRSQWRLLLRAIVALMAVLFTVQVAWQVFHYSLASQGDALVNVHSMNQEGSAPSHQSSECSSGTGPCFQWTDAHQSLQDRQLERPSHRTQKESLNESPKASKESQYKPIFSRPTPHREYPHERGFHAHGSRFYLDGYEFRILSGSFHYFRTHPDQWEDRLLKMKWCGLNTVSTYVPWNLHEPIKGNINFTGFWNLEHFITLVQKHGLKLIIRPGPYMCGEWEYGGLPSWLLSHSDVKVRTSTQPYRRYVENYMSKLLPLLASKQYGSTGEGPIIAFQLENEYASYARDPKYLAFLKQLYIKHGIKELIFTSDSLKYMRSDNTSLDGVLRAINLALMQKEALSYLKDKQPEKPAFVAEFYPGYFDHWRDRFHNLRETRFVLRRLLYILAKGASINIYMFVGGTNFGFMNGATNSTSGDYRNVATNYDFDAPISENGDLSEKYFGMKNLFQGLQMVNYDNYVLRNSTKQNYGTVSMSQSMPYQVMFKLFSSRALHLQQALPMEYLDINNNGGQSYGWLLYRNKVSSGKKLRIKGGIYDRAQIFVDGEPIKVLDWTRGPVTRHMNLPKSKDLRTLDILVENLGRVYYKYHLDEQRKGILGEVFLDDKQLTKWCHLPLDFSESFIHTLSHSSRWEGYKTHKTPASYRGFLRITGQPTDTFINFREWTKGVVLVNGFNIGRYWNVGPQRTLFVPAPILKEGSNEIIIFELHQAGKRVYFDARHELGWEPGMQPII